jgi:hypothetical protein
VLSVGDPLQVELDVPECMRLLGTAGLGRLGFTQAALPVVQPVTYRLTKGAVLIPAVPGNPTTAAITDAIVVLGVDSFGSGQTDGWAVTVVGPIRLVARSCLLLEPVVVTGWRRPGC